MVKRIIVFTIAVIISGIIGYIDYATGQEILLTTFYLIPVAIAVWFSELLYGIIMCMFCSSIWYYIEIISGTAYSSRGILYWDTFIFFSFMIIFAFLLDAVKKLLEKESLTARTDYLTGIANRRYFMEILESEMSRTGRSDGLFTLAYFDADNFKHVNDTLGHYAGDMVLQITAGILKEHTRKMDSIARLGGDEFAVLFPLLGMKDAAVILEKLKQSLSNSMRKNGYSVTFSIGAVVFTKMPSSADDMVKIADKLMYEVKKDGKDMIKLTVF
jgi:diguanylate cyclase (GGDEF)-like protein